SICSMTGYQHLFVEKDEFNLLTDEKELSTYTFGTHTAQHYFCKTCGIKSFYIPRSHPYGYSVNLRCVDQSKFTKIEFQPFDGGHWEENIEGLVGDGN
ncbi:MAG: GFA family protein, partial [Acidimicrobiales bacterium]